MLSLPKRRENKIDSSINIVPYIDVMLVLLVIFMMTTPIMEQGIDVDLPSAASGKVVDFSQNYPIIVSISKDGSYYINSLDSDNQDKQKVAIETLTAMIKGRLNASPNTQIFIRADKNLEYKFIVNLMSFLQENNIQKVGLITESINLK